MEAQTALPFVDTNIIPDRNAGIGSLLWDLQNPRGPDRDEPPLLDPVFAFIDVGVSRAQVSATLKTLLARDLGMDVEYVATERPDAVPCTYVTLEGDRAQTIRGYLSRMISSRETKREITNWHYVIDRRGKVSSVSYSYNQHGNEVWESYFMGRTFMVSGEEVEFLDPALDEVLVPDVPRIEATIALDRKRDSDPSQPGLWRDGYRIERHPLESRLAACGIALQRTDVPHRIPGRQNVLFLGNVLNHYPLAARAREFDRITAHMQEGDVIITQVDEVETGSIEVLHVTGQGRERARWIDTRTLEVQQRVHGSRAWRHIRVGPELERTARRLVECLERTVSSPGWGRWGREDHRGLVRQSISQVFSTFFRALPVEATLRIAIREAVRRLPSEGGPKGNPVFQDDAADAYGGALGSDTGPVVSEADLIDLGLSNARRGVDGRPGSRQGEMQGERPEREGHR